MKKRPVFCYAWLLLFLVIPLNGSCLNFDESVLSDSLNFELNQPKDSSIFQRLLSTEITDSAINFKKRRTLCYAVGLGGTALAHIALSQLWYKDFPQSKFHFFNDNKEWLQMDKCGHAFSSYYLGLVGIEAAKWAGVPKNKQWKWAIFGSIFQDPIEIWDGLSAGWGASLGDLAANTTGTLLSAGQQALWQEQKIKMKFSFHTTNFAKQRPNVLGQSLNEQLLKDYNGQTYWLCYSPIKKRKWIGLAIGYGANGMLGGFNNVWTDKNKVVHDYSNTPRYRQYYLSLDIDFTQIKTKSKFLKTLFFMANCIKIPAPALEFCRGKFSGHGFYF